MATPNPMYYACFPLQEYFVNKDTGFPLAGGYVEFFSDPAFTVPKDVFQQSLVGGTTYDYVNLGSTLVLSSVGTFMDNNGDDIIPFLYPYDANGQVQLYFIRVWSGDPSVQGSVLQFTRQGWPPNFAQGTSPTDVFESSQNVFSNPEFAIVNFTPNPATSKYTIAVSGAGSFEVAPGWSLSYAGTGNLSVKQIEIVTEYVSTPSYALQVESDAGVVSIKLTQRLYQSPRTFYGNFLSASVLAACLNTSAVAVTIDYIPNSGTSYQIVSGVTTDNNEFELISGVNEASVYIDNVANTNPPSTGYIDLVINVPSGRIMQFTSLLAVTVQNASSLVTNIQSSNAQQTNGLFWYYKPELEYKPIPSYTLGWNWPLNPCQELGTTVAAASNTPGFSRYVADETIVFQNVDNTIACGFNNAGMGITPSADTSFAIIKYFSGAEVADILSTPLSVQLKAGGAVANASNLIANVSIWYTFDASLPDLKSPNFYSLVSSVDNTTGVATVGGGGVHGTWYEVPRSGLGAAIANLKTSNVPVYNFNGWVYNDVTPATSVKYCAIVISVSKLTAAVGCTFEYCTLNSGYIATRPQADSFGENLQALQQYYEKSWDALTVPGTNTVVGSLVQQLSGQMYYSAFIPSGNQNFQWTCLNNSNFGIRFIVSKRTNNVAVTVYSKDGTAGQVFAAGFNNGSPVLGSNLAISTWNQYAKGENGVDYLVASPATRLYENNQNPGPINPSVINGYLNYHYVADARLGIV